MSKEFAIADKITVTIRNDLYEIIENDRLSINPNEEYKKATFYNLIIKNYINDCEATLENYREVTQDYFDELSKDEVFNKCDEDDINNYSYYFSVAATKKKKLSIEESFKEDGVTIQFRLNSYNQDNISEMDLEAENYNFKIGKYLRAILEEYATKSFAIREQIIFKDIINTINSAINEGDTSKNKSMEIIIQNGKKFTVKPYKIIYDKSTVYNYLVGLSKSSEQNEYIPAGFRISKISKIKVNSSRPSGKITVEELKKLTLAIKEKGPNFLIGKNKLIKIKLTENGIKNYNNFIFLRPQYVDIEPNNVYVFNCPFANVISYFFKFGSDATILEPDNLKEIFINKYKEALEKYNK